MKAMAEKYVAAIEAFGVRGAGSDPAVTQLTRSGRRRPPARRR